MEKTEWVRCPVCGNKAGLQTVKTPKNQKCHAK